MPCVTSAEALLTVAGSWRLSWGWWPGAFPSPLLPPSPVWQLGLPLSMAVGFLRARKQKLPGLPKVRAEPGRGVIAAITEVRVQAQLLATSVTDLVFFFK